MVDIVLGPDENIASSLLWILLRVLVYFPAKLFYGLELVGAENLEAFDQNGNRKGVLVYSLHSTHNVDIVTTQQALYDSTGRIARGMLHKTLYSLLPWIKYAGIVAGRRKTAIEILKHGYMVGVLPGGAEEALWGHEHAYDLHPRWKDRQGFACAAMEAGVPLVPLFCRNVEEMKFNPFFFAANKLGLSSHLESMWKLPYGIGWMCKQLSLTLWWLLSWVSFPIPVKITVYIGKPVPYSQDEDPAEVSHRAHDALEELVNKYQPHRHQYLPGLIERYEYLCNKPRTKQE